MYITYIVYIVYYLHKSNLTAIAILYTCRMFSGGELDLSCMRVYIYLCMAYTRTRIYACSRVYACLPTVVPTPTISKQFPISQDTHVLTLNSP